MRGIEDGPVCILVCSICCEAPLKIKNLLEILKKWHLKCPVLPSGMACKTSEWHQLSSQSEHSPQNTSARGGGRLCTTT